MKYKTASLYILYKKKNFISLRKKFPPQFNPAKISLNFLHFLSFFFFV